MAFAVHGDVKVAIKGQIIIAQVHGPWNIELIQLYRDLISPLIAQVSAKGLWGLIVQVTGSVVCPPDALALIQQGANADILASKRCCTSYVIHPDTEGYNLMLPIWFDIYRDKNPFEIFATIEAASEWVLQKLPE